MPDLLQDLPLQIARVGGDPKPRPVLLRPHRCRREIAQRLADARAGFDQRDLRRPRRIARAERERRGVGVLRPARAAVRPSGAPVATAAPARLPATPAASPACPAARVLSSSTPAARASFPMPATAVAAMPSRTRPATGRESAPPIFTPRGAASPPAPASAPARPPAHGATRSISAIAAFAQRRAPDRPPPYAACGRPERPPPAPSALGTQRRARPHEDGSSSTSNSAAAGGVFNRPETNAACAMMTLPERNSRRASSRASLRHSPSRSHSTAPPGAGTRAARSRKGIGLVGIALDYYRRDAAPICMKTAGRVEIIPGRSTPAGTGGYRYVCQIFHIPRTRSLPVLWLAKEMGLPYEIARRSSSIDRAPDPTADPSGKITDHPRQQRRSCVKSTAILHYLTQIYGPTPLALAPGQESLPDYVQFLIFGEA